MHIDPLDKMLKEDKRAIERIGFFRHDGCFIQWYIQNIGSEWKLITDVLNYHPFTKGNLKTVAKVTQYYEELNKKNFRSFYPRCKYNPLSSDNIPLLIYNIAPVLFNAIHKDCI